MPSEIFSATAFPAIFAFSERPFPNCLAPSLNICPKSFLFGEIPSSAKLLDWLPNGAGSKAGFPRLLEEVLNTSFFGSYPPSYPGILSEIIELISGAYLLAILAGITASPGDSIAGTTSPLPFGPGTDTTPLLYPIGSTVFGFLGTAILTPE